MKRRPDLHALIAKHRELDVLIGANRADFLSDWNCDNPLAEEILGPELARLARCARSGDAYIYFDEETQLLDKIRGFHADVDGQDLSRRNIVAGPGSSSFLAAFAVWLRRSGYTDVYCVPPLYHTFYFLLESLDITVTPVANEHAYARQFSMNLPNQHTVLLLCDPVWYAGRYFPATQMATIAEWQRATKSLVFVDGSFQYMKWNGERREQTATLPPDLTFRLICPAKTLAVPLFRFAYLLHPSSTHDDIMFLYESMIGGTSAADAAFAARAIDVLSNDSLATKMPDHFRRIYQALVDRDMIKTSIAPECGYFVFAAPMHAPAGSLAMDQSYFELTGYPNYCRINLMAARRIYGLD